jgi:hypothetical protein
LFIAEEREKELEDAYVKALVDDQRDGDGEEAGVATRKTVESLKCGEKVLEAICLAEEEAEKMRAYYKVRQLCWFQTFFLSYIRSYCFVIYFYILYLHYILLC